MKENGRIKRMKISLLFVSSFILLLLQFFFATCATTSKCECENSNGYSKRKSKISLIDYQKNSTFALQKDTKMFLI